jgi:hypothetical protein
MRKHLNELSAYDYFSTESDIFRKLAGLRELLTSQSFERDTAKHFSRPIRYQLRRFFINASGDFFDRQDLLRYQQTREDCLLMPPDANLVQAEELSRDLFDEDYHASHRPRKRVQRT